MSKYPDSVATPAASQTVTLEHVTPGWWLLCPAGGKGRPFVLRIENPAGLKHSSELARGEFLFLHDL